MVKKILPDQESQAEEMHQEMLGMLVESKGLSDLSYAEREGLVDLTNRVQELASDGITVNGLGLDEVRSLVQSARKNLDQLIASSK